jgi:transcriptional regulator with XRE-family HTH domain
MSLPTKSSSDSPLDVESELGKMLDRVRVQRGFSRMQLAKAAGVSRRHITAALNGANVSVSFLRKLLRALNYTVTIGPEELTFKSASINPAQLAEIVPYLERAMIDTQAAAGRLRELINRDPERGDELTDQAADLVERFARHVAADPQSLVTPQTNLDEVINAEPAAALPRRRKK